MKRVSLTVILVFSLLGAPMPAQAANGMADMMGLMMEMFLWMMTGGGGFNPNRIAGAGAYNPYSMGSFGGIGSPLMANSMLGNPLLNNSIPGNPAGWGNTLPYTAQGMYAPYTYPGMSPYSNANSSRYGSPYYGNNYTGGYGYQPNYGPGSSNPFYLHRFSRNPYDSRPYKRTPDRPPTEKRNYRSWDHASEKAPPINSKPIDVNPTRPSAEGAGRATDLFSNPVETKLPQPYPLPEAREPLATQDNSYNEQSMDNNNPLYGHWQGVNGEYMELGHTRFRLQSGDTDLQGTYQLRNSILKAEIPNREEPVYMQYQLNDGYLIFLSEDGQKMLLRRLP